MSKKLSPERIAEIRDSIYTRGHAVHKPHVVCLMELLGHIEALEADLAAREKLWAEQTVMRCDASARIEALEAELKVHADVAQEWANQCQRSQKELAESKAECERLRDNPSDDATDAAHPAWWRGHDNGANGMAKLVEKLRAEGERLRARIEDLTERDLDDDR